MEQLEAALHRRLHASGRVSKRDLRPQLLPGNERLYELFHRCVLQGDGVNLDSHLLGRWLDRNRATPEEAEIVEQLLYAMLSEYRSIRAERIERETR